MSATLCSLESAIQSRDGKMAVELFLHHPDGEFATAFNAITQSVEVYADKVLIYTMRTLARQIAAGQITSVEQLGTVMHRVLRVNVKHFRHRERTERTAQLRLLGNQIEHLESREVPPEIRLSHSERLPELLRGARHLGYVSCRVIREFRRYEEANGTRKGAYPHLARLANIDATGRIIGFERSLASESQLTATSSRPLISRVRKLHLKALARLHTIAAELGFAVPSYL